MAITNLNDKVGSHLMAVYLDTGHKEGGTTPVYDRVGSNCESLSINLNTETTEYSDVTMDTAQSDISAYKTTIEGTGKYQDGDPVYDYFLGLWEDNKTGNSSRADMYIAKRFQEDATTHECNALLFEDTTVSLSSFELTGADLMEVSFTLAANTSPKKGTVICNESDNYKTCKNWTASN